MVVVSGDAGPWRAVEDAEHGQDEERGGELAHRGEVGCRIERQLLVECGGDRVSADQELDGVTVRRCLGDKGRGKIAAGSGLGFDDDRLAQILRHLVGHDPRHHVGIAARSKALHQRDRPRWIGILGDRNKAEIADYDVSRHGSEIRMLAGPFIEFTDNPKNVAVSGQGQTYEAWKRYRVFVPNAMKLNSSAGPVEDYVLFVATAPVERKVTRCFTFMARNYGFDQDEEFDALQRTILAQDKPVVESQLPEELPVDLTAEMHVKAADLGTVEYRRWLIEIADGTIELAPAS